MIHRSSAALGSNLFWVAFFPPQSNTSVRPWAGKLVAIVTAGGEASHLSPAPQWRLLSNLCCSGHTAARVEMAPFLHTPPSRSRVQHFFRDSALAPCLWFIWCVCVMHAFRSMCLCISMPVPLSLSVSVSTSHPTLFPDGSQAPCLIYLTAYVLWTCLCICVCVRMCECRLYTQAHKA